MASRLRNKLNKARTLSHGEWWTLAQASTAVPAVWVALRVQPLPRLLEWLHPGAEAGSSGSARDVITEARRAAWLVDVAARPIPVASTCLTRSVTLWWLLRRRGVPAEIRLGVQHDTPEFAAHAWVEVDGKPVNDTAPEERYAAFAGGLSGGR